MGFLKFLLAIVLVIIGFFGLLYIVFGTIFANLAADMQRIPFSLIPSIFIGLVFFVLLVLGFYLLRR